MKPDQAFIQFDTITQVWQLQRHPW